MRSSLRPKISSMCAFSFAYLTLFAFVAQTRADFTGIELYKACNNIGIQREDRYICLAYIRGFSEGYYSGITIGVIAEQSHRRICYPQPPTEKPPDPTQAELIIKKYMADHPDELNKPAMFLVQDALATAFRCRK